MILDQFGSPILKVRSGSYSYGTNVEGSDLDERGIFVPHRKFYFGFNPVDQFDDPNSEDAVWFSLNKFVSLALECNPNVVEQLFVREQDILFMNEFGKELRDMRYEFLTKNSFARFGGYAFSQLKRLNGKNNGNHHGSHKHLIDAYGYDTKHAMHLVRLLQMGIEILETGDLHTYRPNRELLLNIRNGLLTLPELLEFANQLEERHEVAMRNSTIPDFPDFDKINKWVIDTVDRVHNVNPNVGVFRGVAFNVLPVDYEMVDKCSALLVSNRLQRRKSRSEAVGVVVPYKDWYLGLREFEYFRYDNTLIDEFKRAVNFVMSSDFKMVDMIFASDKHVIYAHPMADKLKSKLKTLLTTDQVYNKAYNYIIGNLKGMDNWECMKDDWNKQKENDSSLTVYPPVPKKTDPENSSMMTKFGYDTLSAFNLYHILNMAIELLETGTMVDSRAYEPEMYAIKHAKYSTYSEYRVVVDQLLVRLKEAKANSKLPSKVDRNEVEEWVIEFISEFHKTV